MAHSKFEGINMSEPLDVVMTSPPRRPEAEEAYDLFFEVRNELGQSQVPQVKVLEKNGQCWPNVGLEHEIRDYEVGINANCTNSCKLVYEEGDLS